MADLPWNRVEPMPRLNGDVESVLESVRSLQRAWKAAVSANDRAFQEARRRSLRRHAIETGVIERLYDIDWGVTEALVAEGLTADAVARAGDGTVSEDVLETIRSQYDALEFLAAAAREGRELSISLIKEMHVALTRSQQTYTARGPAGLIFEATLHHGRWKTQPNHVTRQDGSSLQYTPPEQVESEMDQLVALYRDYSDYDPIIRSAWLHHRFVRIHPFEDGNGRVARSLTLLELLKNDLAPLVVDRRQRDRYLHCLDEANDGDLRPLVRFFAELEIVALRSELERPVEADDALAAGGGSLAVLDAGIARLRELNQAGAAGSRGGEIVNLAGAIQERIYGWLDDMTRQLETKLRDGIDENAYGVVQFAAPPDQKARYWHRQVVTAARNVDFYANLQNGLWWVSTQVTALGQRLRYLVFLQKVGRGETGVLTLTTYAETLSISNDRSVPAETETVMVSAPTETVTWTYTDNPGTNWDGVVEVLDTTLAAALAKYISGLG